MSNEPLPELLLDGQSIENMTCPQLPSPVDSPNPKGQAVLIDKLAPNNMSLTASPDMDTIGNILTERKHYRKWVCCSCHNANYTPAERHVDEWWPCVNCIHAMCAGCMLTRSFVGIRWYQHL